MNLTMLVRMYISSVDALDTGAQRIYNILSNTTLFSLQLLQFLHLTVISLSDFSHHWVLSKPYFHFGSSGLDSMLSHR